MKYLNHKEYKINLLRYIFLFKYITLILFACMLANNQAQAQTCDFMGATTVYLGGTYQYSSNYHTLPPNREHRWDVGLNTITGSIVNITWEGPEGSQTLNFGIVDISTSIPATVCSGSQTITIQKLPSPVANFTVSTNTCGDKTITYTGDTCAWDKLVLARN